MTRSILSLSIFLLSYCCSPLEADETRQWQAAQLKRLKGRWMTVQEVMVDKDKYRRRQLHLECTDNAIKIYTASEKGKTALVGTLKLVRLEYRRLNSPLLIHHLGNAAYDFVGRKLIVVGRIGPRPWEGFGISGEYIRVKTEK